ncbi:hypothetical protein ACSBR2_016209 [Camellia fascicularis]
MKKSFILLVILTFHLLCSTTMSGLFPSYWVYIINNLPANSNSLQVHCQSKDNDLGMRTLQTNQEFNWFFRVNFIGTTLFFCHFYWNTKNISFAVYDSRLDSYCSTALQDNYCYWSVRADGFHISNDEMTWIEINNWPS